MIFICFSKVTSDNSSPTPRSTRHRLRSVGSGSAIWCLLTTATTWFVNRSLEISPEQISSSTTGTSCLERERKLSLFWILEKSKSISFDHEWLLSFDNLVFVCLKPSRWFYDKNTLHKKVLELSAIFKMVSHVPIGRFWLFRRTSTTSWWSYQCWWRQTCW